MADQERQRHTGDMRKPQRMAEREIRPVKIRLPQIKEDTHVKAAESQEVVAIRRQAVRFERETARILEAEAAKPAEQKSIRARRLDPLEISKRRSDLRYKTFRDAVQGCRDLHPLPVELIENQLPDESNWLIQQLTRARTREELTALADSLKYPDLAVLFTALANLKKKEETDLVQNLIRLRASHYLYLCGWLTLQCTYPRSSVSKALADLCIILEDIRFARENERRVQRRSRPLPGVPLGPWRMVWSRVPLISGIALPNSRHFISDIAGAVYDSGGDLNAFFHEYAIYPGLPLAEAITVRYKEMVSGVAANPMLSQDFFDRFRKPGD
ncbi:MAG: hypothetical protein WDA02_05085 [Saccharofermentanales bacterium]